MPTGDRQCGLAEEVTDGFRGIIPAGVLEVDESQTGGRVDAVVKPEV
jgi:hypothetical protein